MRGRLSETEIGLRRFRTQTDEKCETKRAARSGRQGPSGFVRSSPTRRTAVGVRYSDLAPASRKSVHEGTRSVQMTFVPFVLIGSSGIPNHPCEPIAPRGVDWLHDSGWYPDLALTRAGRLTGRRLTG